MIDHFVFLGQSGVSLERLATLCLFVDGEGLSRALDDIGPEPSEQSRKARQSRLSQFSRQLKELEQFFGLRLTRKEGREIKPTEDARRLAREARGYLANLRDAWRRGQAPCPIAMGAGHSYLEWRVMPRLGRLQGLLKDGQTLRLDAVSGQDAIDALDQRQLDCAVLRKDLVERSPLESREVLALDYSLFTPRGLGGGKDFETMVQRLPMALARGSRFRKQLEEAFQAAGLNLKPVLECSSHALAAAAVAAGTHGAILPAIARAFLPGSGVKEVPLPGGMGVLLNRTLVLAWTPGGGLPDMEKWAEALR